MPDEVIKATIKPEKEMASVEWGAMEREKAPWIKPTIVLGKTVLPPNDQKSNLKLTNEQVLQPRAEPIGNSSAPPISGRGQDKGAVETSRSKQIHSDSGVSGI